MFSTKKLLCIFCAVVAFPILSHCQESRAFLLRDFMVKFPQASLYDLYCWEFEGTLGPRTGNNLAVVRKDIDSEYASFSNVGGYTTLLMGTDLRYVNVNLGILIDKYPAQRLAQVVAASAPKHSFSLDQWRQHWNDLQPLIDQLPNPPAHLQKQRASIAAALDTGFFFPGYSVGVETHGEYHYRTVEKSLFYKEIYPFVDSAYHHKTSIRWQPIARKIVPKNASAREKFYAIYRYLCDNIAYDVSYSIHEADVAWQKKRAVCEGYSQLFYQIAKAAGLKTNVVSGIAFNTYGYNQHAWIEAIDGSDTLLIDPTWGAGNVNGGVFIPTPANDAWFDVNPAIFALSHCPDDLLRQHISPAITISQYDAIPHFTPEWLQYGLPADSIVAYLATATSPLIPYLASGSDFHSSIRFHQIPLTGTLQIGQPATFAVSLLSEGYRIFFAYDNGSQRILTPEESAAMPTPVVITPKQQALLRMVLLPQDSNSGTVILQYEVQ